jgi:hypothetical protein
MSFKIHLKTVDTNLSEEEIKRLKAAYNAGSRDGSKRTEQDYYATGCNHDPYR